LYNTHFVENYTLLSENPRRLTDLIIFPFNERSRTYWACPTVLPEPMRAGETADDPRKVLIAVSKGFLFGKKKAPYCDNAEDYWRWIAMKTHDRQDEHVVKIMPEDGVSLCLLKEGNQADEPKNIKLAENVTALVKDVSGPHGADTVRSGLVLVGEILYLTSAVFDDNGENSSFWFDVSRSSMMSSPTDCRAA
jgi:hypothetical protein